MYSYKSRLEIFAVIKQDIAKQGRKKKSLTGLVTKIE